MYGLNKKKQIKKKIIVKSTLQHMPYKFILKHKHIFNINFNNISIITIVRNPYERLISDLFYYKKIELTTPKDAVFEIIKSYLSKHLDNHTIPQYIFITTYDKKLIPNIKILHTETLKPDMINLGYTDFDVNVNTNLNKVDYYNYLNSDSIQLINNYYSYDFELFNYTKM